MRGPLALGFLIFFAVGFVVALAFSLRQPARIREHPVMRRVLSGYASWLAWAFGAGLVFFAFQLMGLPFIGWRIWLWVSIVVVVAAIGYIVYHRTTSFKSQMATYEAQRAKRLYQQQARKRPVGENGVPTPRSSRAEKRRERTTGTAAKGR